MKAFAFYLIALPTLEPTMRSSPKPFMNAVALIPCSSAIVFTYVRSNAGVHRIPVVGVEPLSVAGESIRADLAAYEIAEPKDGICRFALPTARRQDLDLSGHQFAR